MYAFPFLFSVIDINILEISCVKIRHKVHKVI